MSSPGVEEPGMLYNDFTVTWETQLVLLKEVWQTTDKKGECQIMGRESDYCVIPVIPSNVGGGKAVTYYRFY